VISDPVDSEVTSIIQEDKGPNSVPEKRRSKKKRQKRRAASQPTHVPVQQSVVPGVFGDSTILLDPLPPVEKKLSLRLPDMAESFGSRLRLLFLQLFVVALLFFSFLCTSM